MDPDLGTDRRAHPVDQLLPGRLEPLQVGRFGMQVGQTGRRELGLQVVEQPPPPHASSVPCAINRM
jgi:hypothetical protein